MSDSACESVGLAEGIRLGLKGLGLILTEMGEYTARVSEMGATAETAPAASDPAPATASTDASTAESEPAPAATPTGMPTAAPTPSVDDITKLIVQKLKENGSLNEKIQEIVKKYDVDTVKDIPEEKRADFVEQLKKL